MHEFGRGWRLVLTVIVLATLTHIPGLWRSEPLNPDETFVATEAKVLVHGGTMYKDVVDRKPPLVPFVVAATQWVTHTTAMLPLRALCLLAHIATALLLAAIARRRWGDGAAFAAAVLYLCASVGLNVTDAQAASFEAIMLPFTAAAYLLAQRDRPMAGGAAAAGAALCKQVGAAALVPVAMLAWRAKRGRGLALAAAGFAVTVMAVAVASGWHAFWFWNITAGFKYADPAGSGAAVLRAAYLNTEQFVMGSVIVLGLAAFGHRRWRDELDLWMWLLVSAVGVASGLHFFGHYYLQLLPPLVLLATSTIVHIESRIAWPAVIGAGGIAVSYIWGGFSAPSPFLGSTQPIMASVETLTSPSDHIFVWGQFPEVYWATGRSPSSRFLTAGFLNGASGGRAAGRVGPEYAVPGGWDQLAADLRAHPAEVIIVTTGEGPADIIRFPVMLELLSRDYTVAAEVDGVTIYKRLA
jgi:hypothetical protein